MKTSKKHRLSAKRESKNFCVKLYCDLPSLCKGIFEEDRDLYLNLRKDICDLVEGVGEGVELLGASGATCTWEIHPSAMMNFLIKIREFNSPSNDMPCIIHVELY